MAHPRLPSHLIPFTMDFLHSSSPEISSVDSESADNLVQLANETTQQPFTTNRSLQNSLEHLRRALQQDQTSDQYLVFTSLPLAQHSRLSDDRSRTSKYCRFSYNAEEQILIAKVMPHLAHELAIRSFDSLITWELSAMNVHREVRPFGSATFQIENWRKEANSSWAPFTPNTRPSFVMEVGLSESSRKLALDSKSWLETYSSPVKIVVTISIERKSPRIIVQQWELQPNYGITTRSSRLRTARRTTSITLYRENHTTIVTGETYLNDTVTATTTQLELSFQKIVGRPPSQPLERNLVIDQQALGPLAEDIWHVQGFN